LQEGRKKRGQFTSSHLRNIGKVEKGHSLFAEKVRRSPTKKKKKEQLRDGVSQKGVTLVKTGGLRPPEKRKGNLCAWAKKKGLFLFLAKKKGSIRSTIGDGGEGKGEGCTFRGVTAPEGEGEIAARVAAKEKSPPFCGGKKGEPSCLDGNTPKHENRRGGRRKVLGTKSFFGIREEEKEETKLFLGPRLWVTCEKGKQTVSRGRGGGKGKRSEFNAA